jgi:hypothetical protein
VLQIALTHTFVSAMAGLEPAATKRVAAFLDKLLRDPRAASLHAELVHSAPDRDVRSLRVTGELRAIARLVGDELLLLFVGHHDEAYSWAAEHCYGCEPPGGGNRIGVHSVPPAAAVPTAPAWMCALENERDLCRALDSAGIDHGLAQ